jgi:hypothetical protein
MRRLLHTAARTGLQSGSSHVLVSHSLLPHAAFSAEPDRPARPETALLQARLHGHEGALAPAGPQRGEGTSGVKDSRCGDGERGRGTPESELSLRGSSFDQLHGACAMALKGTKDTTI